MMNFKVAYNKSKNMKSPQETLPTWGKTASVLLKLFINCNERCHITDAPYCMNRTLFSNKTTYMYINKT